MRLKIDIRELIACQEKMHESPEQIEGLIAQYHEAGKPLKQALDDVQARLRARIISVSDIIDVLTVYTKELDISKTAMEGIMVTVNVHAGEGRHNYPFYKEPESTWFEARFKSGSWIITDIYRSNCGKTLLNAYLPERAKKAIVARFTRRCA